MLLSPVAVWHFSIVVLWSRKETNRRMMAGDLTSSCWQIEMKMSLRLYILFLNLNLKYFHQQGQSGQVSTNHSLPAFSDLSFVLKHSIPHSFTAAFTHNILLYTEQVNEILSTYQSLWVWVSTIVCVEWQQAYSHLYNGMSDTCHGCCHCGIFYEL